jgi:tetratricopeptide (TPR) repeat protein
MAIARHLAPQDRFVLRSAATLLWEQDLPHLAVAALRTSDTHLADPWLLAPLIALSDLAKDKPRGIRDALRLIEDGSLPRSHTAELAAAIGTMEFANGSDRRARQLFRLSLETPIENVLAQAVWLTEKKKISVISELPQQVNRAHEATSRQEAQKLRWVSATDSAMEWLEDQPFSTLAATYGSWTACESRNWTIAMAISERGLVIKPSNPILLNNLAYSQIQASNLKGAVATLIKARSVVIENEDKGALIATEGLALFRGGQLDAGRERYKSAIDLFVSLKKTDSAADAAIMVAMEEVSIDSVQMQPSIDRAIRLIKSVTNLRIHEHMGYLRDSLYAVGKSNLIEGWKAQKPEVVAQIL